MRCIFAALAIVFLVLTSSSPAAPDPGGLHNFEVKKLPDYHVAFVEHTGPYQGDGALFDRLLEPLIAWADPKGLFKFPQTKLIIIYSDPCLPSEKQWLRMCIEIPEKTKVPDGIQAMTLPGGLYAVGRFEIGEKDFGPAWGKMYGELIPSSGHYPGPGLAYEIKLNDSDEHPNHKHLVDICVPVAPIK